MVNPNVFSDDGFSIFITPKGAAIVFVMAGDPWTLEVGESVSQKFTAAADLFNAMGKFNRFGVHVGDGSGK